MLCWCFSLNTMLIVLILSLSTNTWMSGFTNLENLQCFFLLFYFFYKKMLNWAQSSLTSSVWKWTKGFNWETFQINFNLFMQKRLTKLTCERKRMVTAVSSCFCGCPLTFRAVVHTHRKSHLTIFVELNTAKLKAHMLIYVADFLVAEETGSGFKTLLFCRLNGAWL